MAAVALPGAEMYPKSQLPEGELPEDEHAETRHKKSRRKKLTKEERRERKRQREIGVKKLEMQLEFKRELELSRKTAKRLNVDWLNSIREMRLIELKNELTVWEQKAMRQLNEKDIKIHELLEHMNILEEMNLSVAAQLRGIFEYLTDIYKALTDGSKILYEKGACEIVGDFYKELNERSDYDNNLRLYSENVMHTTGVFFEKELLSDYNIFVDHLNDNVNTEIEKRYYIRDGIVQKMKNVKQILIEFVNELSRTELDPKKYERIRQLMDRQHAFVIESERLTRITTKQRRIFGDLQRELLLLETTSQKKINDLRMEHTYFFEIRKQIQYKHKKDHLFTFEKIKFLGNETHVILKHYQKLCKFGELLLSTASSVRKYQTKAEKILILEEFIPSKNISEPDELRKFMLTIINPNTKLQRYEEEIVNEMNLMRIFWRRLALVQTQNAMLEKEKDQLLAENKKYTDFIRGLSNKLKPEKLSDKILLHYIDLPTRSSY